MNRKNNTLLNPVVTKKLSVIDKKVVSLQHVSTKILPIMEIDILLEYCDREQLRRWLEENHSTAHHCWVAVYRGKTPMPNTLPYLVVVEECLCFGWIDSTLKRSPDGRLAQRISPRHPNSH